MRDPNRISDILAKIEELWEEQPDLRLMQLLINALRPENPCSELYSIEDAKLKKRLIEYGKLMVKARRENK
jgi:hypothetical protein